MVSLQCDVHYDTSIMRHILRYTIVLKRVLIILLSYDIFEIFVILIR